MDSDDIGKSHWVMASNQPVLYPYGFDRYSNGKSPEELSRYGRVNYAIDGIGNYAFPSFVSAPDNTIWTEMNIDGISIGVIIDDNRNGSRGIGPIISYLTVHNNIYDETMISYAISSMDKLLEMRVFDFGYVPEKKNLSTVTVSVKNHSIVDIKRK